MGRKWVGFQDSAKPVPGRTIHEKASFPAHIPDGQVVALLTTESGLSRWLGSVTAFTSRRGGNLDFQDADGTYGGTFTLIDPPRSIVLVTERHGEISVHLDVRGARTRVDVQCTRFIPDTENSDDVIQRIRSAIARLRSAVQLS